MLVIFFEIVKFEYKIFIRYFSIKNSLMINSSIITENSYACKITIFHYKVHP